MAERELRDASAAWGSAGARIAKSVGMDLSEAGRRSVGRFTLFALLVCSVYVGLFFAFYPAARVLRPYSDMFDLLDAYFRAEQTGNWIGYVLQPHSYHRLPWFRSLIAFDVAALHGTGIPLLVSAFLCLGATAFMLVRQALDGPTVALRLTGAAFVLMLLLTTGNVVHLGVPANTPYAHVLFFSVLAIILAESPAEPARPVWSWRRAGALAAACAAVLSLAAGAVVWAVLAFMAWRRGVAERRWLIAILGAGGGFFSAYILGLTVEDSTGGFTWPSLLRAIDYFFAFLGLPWVRATPEGGRMIGVILFSLSVFAVFRSSGPKASRYERIASALILFSLGVAVLAAAGRQNVAEAVVVPGRYNLLLVPMKTGLVLLALPWLERRLPTRRLAVEGVLALMFALYLAQQIVIGRAVAVSAEQLRETITDFQLGQRNEQMKRLIYPDLARAEQLLAQIQARGLYSERYERALRGRGALIGAPAHVEPNPT